MSDREQLEQRVWTDEEQEAAYALRREAFNKDGGGLEYHRARPELPLSEIYDTENDWRKITIPGRPDILRVREVNGRRQFLVQDNALSFPYYVADEREERER